MSVMLASIFAARAPGYIPVILSEAKDLRSDWHGTSHVMSVRRSFGRWRSLGMTCFVRAVPHAKTGAPSRYLVRTIQRATVSVRRRHARRFVVPGGRDGGGGALFRAARAAVRGSSAAGGGGGGSPRHPPP